MTLRAVLDTEGYGTPYNVGLNVIDGRGETVFELSCWARDAMDDLSTVQAVFDPEHVSPRYQMFYINEQRFTKVEKGACNGVIFETVAEMLHTLREILKGFNLDRVYAYNAGFDRWMIRGNSTEWGDVEFLDIMQPFKAYIKQEERRQARYENYTRKAGRLTAKKKEPQYTAEAAAAFINKNPELKEDHEGLSDCRIEGQILMFLQRRKALYDHIPGNK